MVVHYVPRKWDSAEKVPAGALVAAIGGNTDFRWKRWRDGRFLEFHRGKPAGMRDAEIVQLAAPAGLREAQL